MRVATALGGNALLERTQRPEAEVQRQSTRRLAQQRGWAVAPDNQHFRRVVASPRPVSVVKAP